MKHTVRKAFLAVSLLSAALMPIKAEDLSPDKEWHVTFNGKALTDDFSDAKFKDVIAGMQPGDEVTFTVNILNQYDKEIAWWMSNNVTKSFEESSIASGGAYSYRLTYKPSQEDLITIYDSDIVGGEDDPDETIGLHEATTALKDFKFLEKIKPNQGGTVKIYVKLDGETQGNRYQDTAADLDLRFAVELPTSVPKTGDDRDNSLYYALIGVSGLAILLILFLRHRDGKEAE